MPPSPPICHVPHICPLVSLCLPCPPSVPHVALCLPCPPCSSHVSPCPPICPHVPTFRTPSTPVPHLSPFSPEVPAAPDASLSPLSLSPLSPGRRPGQRALQEIRKYQSSTLMLLRAGPFSRLVREICLVFTRGVDYRWQRVALMALQEAAEAFMEWCGCWRTPTCARCTPAASPSSPRTCSWPGACGGWRGAAYERTPETPCIGIPPPSQDSHSIGDPPTLMGNLSQWGDSTQGPHF
nr:uncharacterized protein LOC110360731 isoform X1 [Columba livia]